MELAEFDSIMIGSMIIAGGKEFGHRSTYGYS
jgi:hypothetical protein